jgi:hypothetical protein
MKIVRCEADRPVSLSSGTQTKPEQQHQNSFKSERIDSVGENAASSILEAHRLLSFAEYAAVLLQFYVA